MPKPTRARSQPQTARAAAPDRFRPWLLATLVALCVARPLLASEAVSWLGDGQPFNMLWLTLALLTSLTAVGRGGFSFRRAPTDLAVAVLVAWMTFSALWSALHASPRPSINMLWEWAALGLVYFLTRELVRSAAERRAITGVMLALAVCLACDGYYQYFVSMPADRAAYARDPDAALGRAGQWFARGSLERQQFENRLQSTEPLATFALTNSLAGFLTPWLVLAVGIAASWRVAGRAWPRRAMFTLWTAALLIAGCLLLTKSRSAYLASLIGLVLLGIWQLSLRGRINLRLAFAVLAAIAVLVGAAIVIGGVDAAVWNEAGKSLGYRLEYWRSTWAMITEHPWLGCGPGNFQDAYTRYKLPQASEEIQDPHNFLLEVWATGGTPALAALLVVLGTFLLQVRRSGLGTSRPADQQTTCPQVAGGAAAGLWLAWFLAPLVGLEFAAWQAVGGMIVGGALLAGLRPWIAEGQLPCALLAIALVALCVNLLAAGGIAFPGVAYSFWMLIALGVSAAQEQAQLAPLPSTSRAPRIAIAATSACLVAAVACYLTAYQPTLASSAAMSQAAGDESRHDPLLRELALLEAAGADPWNWQPWQGLAEADFDRLLVGEPDAKLREQFEIALGRVLALRPQSSSAWRQAGQWLIALYDRGEEADAQRAIDHYARAAELYPNSALTRAEWALALEHVGRRNAAREQAQRALELDDLMPHADKKLPADLRQRVQTIGSDAASR